MKLINIGFGSMVAASRLLSILAPDSAPIKRIIQEARDRGMLIDASYGRKTKAVLLMDTAHVILSAISPETITARFMDKQEKELEEDELRKTGCDFRRFRRGKRHGSESDDADASGFAVLRLRHHPASPAR